MPLQQTRIDYRQLIPELRKQIWVKYQSNTNKYNYVDINKVAQNEWMCLRYIKWNRGDIDKSVEQLNACLLWRNEFGVSNRSKVDLPQEFVRAGAIFPYGYDLKGRTLLYMRIKVYRKVPQLIKYFKQFVVGVIDKVDTQSGATGFVLVFDMTGMSFANVDMQFLQFLINTFRNYFPYGLRYVIVYNMPRLLRSLWSVAKIWIGSQQKIIMFANGDEIKELIPLEQLPRYLGGSGEQDFTIPPEGCKSVQELASKYGFTDLEVKQFMEIFEPHMKEAQDLVRGVK